MRIAIYSHSIAPSIDGVCRRFTGLLKELSRQGHELLLFTLEDAPQDIATVSQFVTLDHMIIPSYPEKKVARPNLRNLVRMWTAIRNFKPDVSLS
jgi:UDP:flavonoid glycosyltransferase YjiC (YdhE family)